MEAKTIEKKLQTDMKTLTDTHSKEMETARVTALKLTEALAKIEQLRHELDQERKQ